MDFFFILSFSIWKIKKNCWMIMNMWVRAVIRKKKKANRYGYDRWHKTWNSRAQNWNSRRPRDGGRERDRICDPLQWRMKARHSHEMNPISLFYDTHTIWNDGMACMCLLCANVCVCVRECELCVSRVLDYLLYHFSFSIVAMSSQLILKSTKTPMNWEIIIGMKPISKRRMPQLWIHWQFCS